jgi:hypothetical protein
MTIKAVLVYNYFNPFKDPVSILAALIRFFSRSSWNHVELLIEDGKEKYVIGAVFPEVRKVSFEEWEKFIKRKTQVMEISSSRSPEEMIDIAKALVGLKYDRDALLIFMPFYLIHKLWLGRQNQKASKAFYCFEVLGFVAGWPDFYKITPKQAIERLTTPAPVWPRQAA